ncbi:hypothetical protein Nepgr_023233 [Nepenthes gracilis]|uniref:Uncharacterized protein n=1 Tax=Nepenthes gracilis TaxID=150966 RepID=A0AAD3XZ69_NEPGR|nr:hypothetical protein Nepgr_023233 [Nepenthes gracilis]
MPFQTGTSIHSRLEQANWSNQANRQRVQTRIHRRPASSPVTQSAQFSQNGHSYRDIHFVPKPSPIYQPIDQTGRISQLNSSPPITRSCERRSRSELWVVGQRVDRQSTEHQNSHFGRSGVDVDQPATPIFFINRQRSIPVKRSIPVHQANRPEK